MKPILKEILPNQVYLIENLLTSEECDEYIKYINIKEIEQLEKYPSKGYNKPRYIGYVENQEQANEFWNKLKDVVPQEYNGRKLKRILDIVPVAKYKNPGTDGTTIHTDIIHSDDIVYASVIYLNDDFEEGETGVFTDNDILIHKTTPKKGDGILFHIKMRHRGYPTKGEKYIIRPRICYT